MPDQTDSDILAAAADLGRRIASHPAAVEYRRCRDAIDADQQTQRLLADYQRAVETIEDKQQKQQPIEVDDKRRVRELQEAVILNPALRALQAAEMNYLDLMRKVSQTLHEAAESGS